MRVVVVSHKVCWRDPASPSGWSTDGGFGQQMAALARLFDRLDLCVVEGPPRVGGQPLTGVRVCPLPPLPASGRARRLAYPRWAVRALPTLVSVVRRTDGVHCPIPGDVGTIGIVLAWLLRRRLWVRHCGNWAKRTTRAERLWPRVMSLLGRDPRHLMLATGLASAPPAPGVEWIFSSSLSAETLRRLGSSAAPQAGRARLLCVARLVPGKGIDLAIGALASLDEHVTLTVVGGGSDLDRLRGLAASAGVSDRVEFTGSLPHAEVLDRLAAADVLLLPSASEGFPKAAVEALAAGRPVVCSDVSSLPSLVGDAGVVVPAPVTVDRLAVAVRGLLADPDRVAAASAEGPARVAGYSLESWAAEIGCRLTTRGWGVST